MSFPGPTSSADYLLKTLLVDFGVISDHETARRRLGSTSREDLLRALDSFLSSLAVLQASALVIFDDAHALPADVLSELRALCQEGAAQRLLQIVRSLWGIENRLHWVLDVVFDEDRGRTRKDNGPENLAILRRFAINLVRAHPARISMRQKVKRAGWDDAFLLDLLSHMR